jgi:hypothetical protein
MVGRPVLWLVANKNRSGMPDLPFMLVGQVFVQNGLQALRAANRKQGMQGLDAYMLENRIRLMQAMYQINRRYGRGSLVLGSAVGIGALPVWESRSRRGCRRGLQRIGGAWRWRAKQKTHPAGCV